MFEIEELRRTLEKRMQLANLFLVVGDAVAQVGFGVDKLGAVR